SSLSSYADHPYLHSFPTRRSSDLIALVLTGSGCTTVPIVALWDATAGSALTSLTISNGTSFFDSGAVSISIVAGHQIDTKVTTAASGCGTQPSLGNMVAVVQ